MAVPKPFKQLCVSIIKTAGFGKTAMLYRVFFQDEQCHLRSSNGIKKALWHSTGSVQTAGCPEHNPEEAKSNKTK